MTAQLRGEFVRHGDDGHDLQEEMDPVTARMKRLVEATYLGNQPHLMSFYNDLTPEDRTRLMDQIETLNFRQINLAFMHAYDAHKAEKQIKTYVPPVICDEYYTENEMKKNHPLEELPTGGLVRAKGICDQAKETWRNWGLQMIANGEVAVVILAGGQGTRLGLDAPKGVLKIGPLSEMSLFQIFTQRLATLQRQAGVASHCHHGGVHLFVMTSEENDEDTKRHFEENDMGLPMSQVHFFKQTMMPCFNKKGKILMKDQSTIAFSPNGNGGVFGSLKAAGMLRTMKKLGVKIIHVVGVDNVLCKLADPTFIGFADLTQAEVVNKCVEREDPTEAVGLFCIEKSMGESKCCVVEYSELSDDLKSSQSSDGSLALSASNICSHAFRLDFIRNISSSKDVRTVYHVALKKMTAICMDEMDVHFPVLDKTPKVPTNPNAVKLEYFVFDCFLLAKRCIGFEVDRASEFAPVKNATGVDSPASAVTMLSQLHRSWLAKAGATFASNAEHEVCEVSPKVSYEGENVTAPAEPIKLPFFLSSPA